jgi:hypothetical protein
MTTFKVREHPMAPQVRARIEAHPVSAKFRERFKVGHEEASKVLTESVLDAMDLLGSRYVTKMTQVVGHLTQLREAIHLVYERVLAGSTDPLDAARLREAFAELHAVTKELADPKTWAEGEGKQVASLPPVEYPGARPGLENKPTVAPRTGEPVPGKAGKAWEVQTKRRGDITLEIDAEGLYWKFPELEDGVVLHFPDYGYSVWKDPHSGAIVEELIVGPSVTGSRRLTRGEDVIFSAADMGEAYRKGGTQRAHGAGSPGLGFDAGYGIAHAIERINGWLENNGVEQWVRNLRDNAEPDVEYVWRTSTEKRGQKLARREYTISAIVDGTLHELYTFEVSVPEGPPNVDAPIDFDITGVNPAAERFGAPVTRKSQAAYDAAPVDDKPPLERLEPPEVVSRALGRTQRPGRTPAGHPALRRTVERIKALTRVLNDTVMKRYIASEDPAFGDAIDEVTDAVGRVDRQIKTSAPDPERLARIDAAITAFDRRAQHATPADLHALAVELQDILRGR